MEITESGWYRYEISVNVVFITWIFLEVRKDGTWLTQDIDDNGIHTPMNFKVGFATLSRITRKATDEEVIEFTTKAALKML